MLRQRFSPAEKNVFRGVQAVKSKGIPASGSRSKKKRNGSYRIYSPNPWNDRNSGRRAGFYYSRVAVRKDGADSV